MSFTLPMTCTMSPLSWRTRYSVLTESPTFFRVAIDSRIFPASSSTTEGATMSKPAAMRSSAES